MLQIFGLNKYIYNLIVEFIYVQFVVTTTKYFIE